MATLNAFLVTGLFALILGAQNIPEGTGIVEGFVRDSVTGQPIEAARIDLRGPWGKANSQQPDGSVPHIAETDDKGHFIFKDLPPDKYTGNVTRIGYLEAVGDFPGFPIAIALEPRQHIDNIEIKLIPGAVISGRVLDSDGQPVVGVKVSAGQVPYLKGRRILGSCNLIYGSETTATTDDRGGYRIFWLHAGEYYLAAEYHPRTSGTPCRAFHPGTFDETAATPIRVRAGAEIEGVNLILPAPPPTSDLFTVSGIVKGMPAGTGGTVESFTLVRRDGPEASPVETRRNVATNRTDGTFQIRDIPPGLYDLWPVVSLDRTDNDSNASVYSSRTVLQIRDHNVEQLSIIIGPGVNLTGRLTIEGQRDLEKFAPWLAFGVGVRIESKDGVPFSVQNQDNFYSIRVNSSTGQFTASGLFPGTYEVTLHGRPDLYLADIRQSGKSVYDEGISIGTAAPSPIEVVVSSITGALEGDVQDRDGRPVSGARMTLVPALARRGRANLYRSGVADANGHFRLTDVPPGDYTVFAWPRGIPDGAVQNATFMAPYERFGTAIHVDADITTQARITVIPSEEP